MTMSQWRIMFAIYVVLAIVVAALSVYLQDWSSYRSPLFFINVALGLLTYAVVYFSIRQREKWSRERFEFWCHFAGIDPALSSEEDLRKAMSEKVGTLGGGDPKDAQSILSDKGDC